MHKDAKKQSCCLRSLYKQLRKEVKGKGEKERYTHLNAEFQRKARSGKKETTSLSEKCKEIEENNRLGQTRDLFKKIRDTIRYQREHFRQRWAQ